MIQQSHLRYQELLYHLVALPASGLWELEALGWMRLLRVPVFAHEGVGVLLLIEITKSVVDFAMFALIRTNYCKSAWEFQIRMNDAYCRGVNRALFGDPRASSSSRRQSQELAASPTSVGDLRPGP